MIKSKNVILKGTLILALFGILAKVLGAFYRIFLTNILGSVGLGLYQFAFPVYTLLLTISTSGIPSALSKIVAEENKKNNKSVTLNIFGIALTITLTIAILSCLLLAVFSRSFASLQGNSQASGVILSFIPAIIFTSGISALRGFLQGNLKFTPTAVSSFIEQFVKLIFGLFFASLLVKHGAHYGAMGAVLGIGVSEFVALIYLYIAGKVYIKKNNLKFSRIPQNELKVINKRILRYIIAITSGALILPLVQLIDSVLIVNLLKGNGFSRNAATALFGLQTGAVGSLINLPAVLSLAVATTILPSISGAKDKHFIKTRISEAFNLTLILALPCACLMFLFSRPIIEILYSGGLNVIEISVCDVLLKMGAVNVFYLAFVQVSTSVLQGLSRIRVPVISLAIGAAVKIITTLILVGNKNVGIYGAEIATALCFLVSLFINLIYIKKMTGFSLNFSIVAVAIVSVIMSLVGLWLYPTSLSIFSGVVSFLLSVTVCGAIYILGLLLIFKNKIRPKRFVTRDV